MRKSDFFIFFWIFLQLAAIVFFGIFVEQEAQHHIQKTKEWISEDNDQIKHKLHTPFLRMNKFFQFQDQQIFVLVGLGMIGTFLVNYWIGAIATSIYIVSFLIQWHILMAHGWACLFRDSWTNLTLTIDQFAGAELAAASFLIAYGAFLGKVSINQLTLIAVIHVISYTLTEQIIFREIKIYDTGRVLLVHTFGGIFGFVVSFFVSDPKKEEEGKKNFKITKSSNQLALFGAIYVWIFFPAFNSIQSPSSHEKHRMILNSILSLSASCLCTFLLSRFYNNKFRYEDIAQASIVGGVLISGAGQLIDRPYISLIIGCVAGLISTSGQNFLPKIFKRLDIRGVFHNHGLAGIIGIFISAIAVGETEVQFTKPLNNELGYQKYNPESQIYGWLIACGIAIGSGIVAGIFARVIFGFFEDSKEFKFYDDKYDFFAARDMDKRMVTDNNKNFIPLQSEPQQNYQTNQYYQVTNPNIEGDKMLSQKQLLSNSDENKKSKEENILKSNANFFEMQKHDTNHNVDLD